MIPKAAMRATNNAMRGYIPHSDIVSAGARIVAGQEEAGDRQGKAEKTAADRDKPQRESRAERENNGGSSREEAA